MSILHEIAEIIGSDMAVKLGPLMGGACVYVPAKMESGHPLMLVLGEEDVQKLCAYYGGDMLDLPSKKMFRQVRDQIISREYHTMERHGNRANILALRHGLSRSQVLDIVKFAA